MPRTAAAGSQDLSSPARSFVGLLVSAAPGGSISTGSGAKNSPLAPLELASGADKNAPANSAATFDWMTTVSKREEERASKRELSSFFDPSGFVRSFSASSSSPPSSSHSLAQKKKPKKCPSPQSTTAYLTLNKLNITFRPKFTRKDGSEGSALVWLSATLKASAVLGCAPPGDASSSSLGGCGADGRCALPPGDAASALCACRCGFAGPSCQQREENAQCAAWASGWPALALPPAAPAAPPSASASANKKPRSSSSSSPSISKASGDAAAPVLGSVAGSAPPPSSAASSLAAAAGVSTLQGKTASGETCTCSASASDLAAASATLAGTGTCPAGWAGANCDACTADDACAASTGDAAATCFKGLTYTPKSRTKSYVCDLSRSPLGVLLDEKRGYWINCTTTPRAWTSRDGLPGGFGVSSIPEGANVTGGACEVGLRLADQMDNPVLCLAVGCVFQPGSTKVSCPTATCACPRSPDGKGTCPELVAPYVSQITGKAVTADCSGPSGECVLNVQGFPLPLRTPCVPGDCQASGYEMRGGKLPSQARDLSSVLAAFPVIFLVALAAVASVQMAIANGRFGGNGEGGKGASSPPPCAAAAPVQTSSSQSPTISLGASAGAAAGSPTAAAAAAALAAVAASADSKAAVPSAAATSTRRGPANPIRELRWEQVTCDVPAPRFAASGATAGVAHWGAAANSSSSSSLGSSAAGPASAAAGAAVDKTDDEEGHHRGRLARGRSTAAALCEAAQEAAAASMRSRSMNGEVSSGSAAEQKWYHKIPVVSSLISRITSFSSSSSASTRVSILRGVSGEAHMGELVGVLGPSGCGKTTMLSILAGSVSSLSASSKVRGHITLDGEKRRAWASRLVAYVPQFDFLLPTLTVAETLRYSAQLRLPAATPARELDARVAATLEELGLSHVASSQVGGSSGIRGVSGGERRRVTIGMELVIDPSIVVLDEPTSGLDSHTALNLMVTLKSVASAGRIVMLSFHQPSPAMFDLLDRVFLMARGHVLFSGAPESAGAFFEAAGCAAPQGTALAEHMLTAVSDPSLRDPLLDRVLATRRTEGAAARQIGGLSAVRAGTAAVDLEGGNTSSCSPSPERRRGGTSPAPSTASTRPPARTPLSRELAVLFWRTLTEIVRNPALLMMHCGMGVAMGALCGGIFFGLQFDIAGAQGRLGAAFFSLTLMALTSLTTVDLLTCERGLVVKEVLGGYYRPVSYYLAKATLDGLLLRVLPAVLFSIPLYPMSGMQRGAPHVALWFSVLSVFSAAVGALSMAVTVGFGTAGRASLVMNLVLLLSLLFAGFLVNVASITPALRWVHYGSVFFYGFEALTANELSGISLTFTAPSGGGGISLPGGIGGGGGAGATKGSSGALSVDIKGDTFLAALGISPARMLGDVAALDAAFFGFVLAGIGLLYWTMPVALVVRPPRGSKEEGGSSRRGRRR